MLLTSSTHFLLLKPQGCGKIGFLCEPHSPLHVAILYISIYLVALGNGAADPALATFGSDQFDEEEPKEEKSKSLFFSYFYVAFNLGSLAAETILAYIETSGNWVLGFWICVGCGGFSFLVFMAGTLRYRHMKTTRNPISRFAQVFVSSMKKIKLQVPANGEGLYDVREGDDRKMHHTKGLMFFDRAAIISTKEEHKLIEKSDNPNPWSLCTVAQVEEVKFILRLLPVWLCTIFSSVVFIQMLSLFVEQGSTMNIKFYKFEIPPASMTAFNIISTSLFIMLFDVLIVPLYVKIVKKEPNLPSELQRIGIGLSITILALIMSGLVDRKRLEFASTDGKETSSLSIFWQIPQYVLVGVAEAFIYVALMNFFTSQAPNGLKSLGMGLSMSTSAVGSYVADTILSIVMKISSTHGRHSWVSPNLNEGHLDWFFFLSAVLTGINLVFYVACATRYKVVEMEKREEAKKEEEVVI